MLRVLISTLLMTAVSAATAEEPAAPSAAQLREAVEASTAAIEAARQSPSTPATDSTWAGALEAARPAQYTGALPGLDTSANVAADVRALMEQARAGRVLDARAAPSAEARPLVFVSLSMPEASFKALLEQSRPVGAALVLRGLVDDSMKRTVEHLGKLLGVGAEAQGEGRPGSNMNLMIDPTLFERFGVNAVPAFVLPLEAPSPCEATGPCMTPRHVKLAGDVSLAYALELMSREANDPGARTEAARWARKIQGPK